MNARWLLLAVLVVGCGGSSAGRPAGGGGPVAAQGLGADGGPPVELVPQLGLPSGLGNAELEMSPDGRLVLAHAPGAVQVFEVSTGKLLRTVRNPGVAPASATWLAGKPLRIACLGKGALVVIDAATGRVERTVPIPAELEVTEGARVAASADGKRVATVHRKGAFDSSVAVWDAAAGRVLSTFAVEARAPDVVLDGDGANVFVTGKSGVDVWSADGKKLRTLEGVGEVRRLALSGDGKRVVAADASRKLFVWDAKSGARVSEMETQYGADALAVSARGDLALTADLDTIHVWSLDSGKHAGYLAGGYRGVRALAMTPDGALAVATNRDGLELWEVPERRRRVRVALAHDPLQALAAHGDSIVVAQASGLVVWDLEKLRVVVDAPQRAFHAGSIAVSADGTRLVTSGEAASVFELPRATLSRGLRGPRMGVTAVAISPDGKLVATGARGDAEPIRLYGPEGQDPIATLGAAGSGKEARIDALAFSPDASRLLAIGDGQLEVFDVTSRARARTAAAPGATSIAIAPDGKTAVTDGPEATVWDLAGGAALGALAGSKAASAVAFSADGKRILVGGTEGSVGIWSAASRAREVELPRQPEPIVAVAFAGKDRFAVLGRADGAVRIARVDAPAKAGAAVTLLAHAGEWLVHGDDGLFDASRHGTALAAVVQGDRAFDIDQLAVRLNRPDVLLERLGLGPPAAIEHYRARHLRRLRKAGLRPEDVGGALVAPAARIERAQRDGKTLTLALDLRAAREPLASYDVWVNGVPVFEKSRAIQGTSARVTERIELGGGSNHVEIACRDKRGTESNRAQMQLDVKEKSPASVFYVGFGVSRYKDARLDLGFAHKDAQDLGRAFEKLQDRKVKTRVHVDQEVTLENVRAAKAFLRDAGIDDTVVLFVAGHGVHAKDAERTYYYLPHGVDTKRLEATAIPFEAIEDVLYGVRARTKLLLLDTCQSGEFDPAEQERAVASAKSRGIRARAARGLVLEGPPAAPGQRRAPWAADRDRFIENDVLRRSGAVVFSSSRGHELSYESDEMQNGYFTAAVLRALRSRIADTGKDSPFLLTSDELHDFVTRWVADKTEGRQHPTIDRDNPDSALGFPVLPGPAE